MVSQNWCFFEHVPVKLWHQTFSQFLCINKTSPKFHPVAFWEAPFNRISSPSPSTTSIGRTISCSSWNLSVRRKSRMKFHHLPPGNPGKIPHSLVSRILKHQQHELAKVIIFIVFSFSCCVEWYYTPASDMKKKTLIAMSIAFNLEA